MTTCQIDQTSKPMKYVKKKEALTTELKMPKRNSPWAEVVELVFMLYVLSFKINVIIFKFSNFMKKYQLIFFFWFVLVYEQQNELRPENKTYYEGWPSSIMSSIQCNTENVRSLKRFELVMQI